MRYTQCAARVCSTHATQRIYSGAQAQILRHETRILFVEPWRTASKAQRTHYCVLREICNSHQRHQHLCMCKDVTGCDDRTMAVGGLMATATYEGR